MELDKTHIDFIKLHEKTNLNEVALILSNYPFLNKTLIINQINGLQKSKVKLPEFYQTNIFFPTPLSLEQCSSEKAALYKTLLIKQNGTLLDLTGGFGVDSYYFAKKSKAVTYVEKENELFNIVQNNFKQLGVNNITCFNTTAEEFIDNDNKYYDTIYIDPSRRVNEKKIIAIEECLPNVIQLKEDLIKKAKEIIIKTSPMLDITKTIKDLKNVFKVTVVAINNECKEVLYHLNKTHTNKLVINTVNLNKKQTHNSFLYQENAKPTYHSALSYLYEPNAAILKSGYQDQLINQFDLLYKIAPNSNLYTSKKLITDFPGRIFNVESISSYNRKQFNQLNIKSANIATRNFKDSVSQIRKKLKIYDGGKTYIFATTTLEKKPILLICTKSTY